MERTFPWKLISFRRKNDNPDKVCLGVWEKDLVIDLSAACEGSGRPRPRGMRDFFSFDWNEKKCLGSFVKKTVELAKKTYSLRDVTLLAPMTDPAMVYDFLGFEKHVRQIRERRNTKVPEVWYKRPSYYVGSNARDKIFGPGEVCIPRFVEKPDYEFELALVVAKSGKPKTIVEAIEFIQRFCFYTILNDWSARDYQKLDMEAGLSVSHSKSMIGNSFGPCLVHASQFEYNKEGVPNISMKLVVNGETRLESNYNTVYWNFAKILAFLGSENIFVTAGDIIGSGTIGNGCIAEFAAKIVDGKVVEPQKYPWLKNGDQIEMIVEKIGTLSSQVRIV